MEKHAFIIMAHNNFRILNVLLELLDYTKNDIYLHIDKKSTIPKDLYEPQKSNLYMSPQRFDVRWGSFSQIELEIYLFNEAYNKGPYKYYHLLSGVDLPIKDNEYIHNWFNNNYPKEFVGFLPCNDIKEQLFRVQNFHFFTNNLKDSGSIYTRIHWKLIALQINYKIKRNRGIDFMKGANWVSITNNCVKYLIENKKFIYKIYKFSFCADEIFLQTLLWNSDLKNNIYNINDEYKGCMRKICWKRGSPYIWRINDYDELISSPYIFARKFDEKEINIVNKIYSYLH